MKLLYKVPLFALAIILFSCSDNGDCGCVHFDSGIEISIKSSIDGSDLLSPETKGFYKKHEIKLFELVDGEILPLSLPPGGELDNQSGFEIFVDSVGIHRMRVFGNLHSGSGIKSNVIKWNVTESDTLSYQVITSSNYTGFSKVWFNDVEVWTEESRTERFFTVEK